MCECCLSKRYVLCTFGSATNAATITQKLNFMTCFDSSKDQGNAARGKRLQFPAWNEQLAAECPNQSLRFWCRMGMMSGQTDSPGCPEVLLGVQGGGGRKVVALRHTATKRCWLGNLTLGTWLPTAYQQLHRPARLPEQQSCATIEGIAAVKSCSSLQQVRLPLNP